MPVHRARKRAPPPATNRCGQRARAKPKHGRAGQRARVHAHGRAMAIFVEARTSSEKIGRACVANIEPNFN
eukprot:9300574-Lingulodinium_polyedra.AAC.1